VTNDDRCPEERFDRIGQRGLKKFPRLSNRDVGGERTAHSPPSYSGQRSEGREKYGVDATEKQGKDRAGFQTGGSEKIPAGSAGAAKDRSLGSNEKGSTALAPRDEGSQ